MAPRNKPTLSKAHKENIRQAALARHAARKEAGLPSPAGLPYVTPPEPAPAAEPVAVPAVAVPPAAIPRILLKDDGSPSLPKPVPAPVVAAVPVVPVDPSLRQAFTAWLRGGKGRDACDPRMSSDPVRLGAELEDRLWLAWQAGHAEGFKSFPLAL